jgi:general secretion pathway protein D
VQTFKRNSWIGCFILLLAASGGITVARTAPQGQQAQAARQTIEEERRKALEKILQDMQKNPQAQPPAQNPAQPAPPPSGVPNVAQRAPLSSDLIALSYDNADLYAFITQIGDMLGITPVIIDPDVKGTVTIHSSAPMPKENVLPIFNIVLKNNNAALVKSEGIYQIVPISQGLRQGLEVIVSLPPTPAVKPAPEKEPAKKQEPTPAGQIKPPAPAAAGAQPPATTPPAAAAAQTPPPAGAQPPLTAPPAAAQTAAGAAAPPPQQAPAGPPARSTAQEPPHLATHVIRVEFVPVQNLIEPLRLFMTEGGVIMPYERLNMLIVTDYTDSMKRLLDVIRLLDSSFLDAELIELVEIKYNASADVLTDLQKIFGTLKDTTTGIYMVSLDRINTIMVMANSKRALEEVKRWITRLDSTTGRSVQTFIYTVENGTASNIAMVLSLLFGGGDTGTTATGQAGGGGGQIAVPGAAGTRGGTGTTGAGFSNPQGTNRNLSTQMGGGQAGFSGSGSMFGGQQGFGGSPYGMGAGMGGQQIGGPRLSQQAGMSAQLLNAGQFSGLQGVVRLVADDINNSLIIQGSAADYAYLMETIKRMDVLPRQAIIDARIFEIELTEALSFGVSATLQGRAAGERLTTGSLAQSTGALSASTFAFVGNAREILMNLDALRQKTKVRILEAPSVLAIDGMTAHIQIGGQVPIPGGTYIGAAGGATTSVSYANTGTELEIMPRISASGTVTLQIAQSVTSVGASTALGPSFSTTNVMTTLAVKDGETVAIAGLIRESDSASRGGIPFLSDIPLLGALFGRTTRSSARTELLIMITPHVIRTPERFREMTEEIQDTLRNVRKYVVDKQKEIMEDQEKARRDRIQQEEKQAKKSDPPAAIKKEEPPAVPPPPIKKQN